MTQVPAPNYATPPGTPGAAPAKSNGAAIGSLICGLLGCVPFITGLIAIILGFIGIKKAKEPGVGGKPLAIIGLILGIVSIVGWGIFFGTIGLGVGAVAKLSEPGRAAAKDWMAAVSAGEIDKAQSLSTGDVTRQELENMSELFQQFGTFSDMTSNSVNLNNNVLSLQGTATFSNTTKRYDITVIKTGDGSWKVQSASVN